MALNTNANIGTRYMTIKLILDPKNGTFSEGNDTKIITCNSDQNSITAEATITKATGFSDSSAYVTIYGLAIEDINSFSRFNISYANEIPENWIEIYAGYELDHNNLPPLAYRGQIRMAGADLNNPSRAFLIISQWGLVNQNTVSPTTAPRGAIDLNSLFKNMSQLFNPPLTYQGNGISGYAYNPNYSGSPLEQVTQAASDYGLKVKQDNGKLLVAPANQPFDNTTYNLNSNTGMLGYPTVKEFGIGVRTRYNPIIQFGQAIQITSELKIANGLWYINGMMSLLQNKGEKWETLLELNTYQFNIQA